MSVIALAFLAVTWWVFFEQGLAPAAYDAFQRPQLLLLVFAVTVLSGGFHEFGHAAAARYSGAEPGVMGAGLYLVWPAFYTDVTDSYRLGRGGRIRTDLGGLYFNALVVVLTFGWWYATGWDALLLLVATQTLQMVQQLLPLLRFDGYHLLADLAGVPDLYHRIRPTLLGLLPHRWNDPDNRLLKPGARAVITLWVLVTVPMMALMLLALVAAVPRLLGTGWSVVQEDAAGVAQAWRSGGPIDIAAHTLQMLAVVLPVIACGLILGRIGLRWLQGLARWSRGSALKRVTAAVVSAPLVTGLAWAWWPYPGNYRPIVPGEQNLFTSLLPHRPQRPRPAAHLPWTPPPSSPAHRSLPVGQAAQRRLADQTPLQATFPGGHRPPHPGRPAARPGPGPHHPHTHTTAHRRPRRTGPTSRTGPSPNPGCSPSTSPSHPRTATTRPPPTTPPTTPSPTTSPSPWSGPPATRCSTSTRPTPTPPAHAASPSPSPSRWSSSWTTPRSWSPRTSPSPPTTSATAASPPPSPTSSCSRSPTPPARNSCSPSAQVWDQLTEFGHNITTYTLTQIADQLDSIKTQIQAILHTAPPLTPAHDLDPEPVPHGGARHRHQTVPDHPLRLPLPVTDRRPLVVAHGRAESQWCDQPADRATTVGVHDGACLSPTQPCPHHVVAVVAVIAVVVDALAARAPCRPRSGMHRIPLDWARGGP